jgi:hypothetical protein
MLYRLAPDGITLPTEFFPAQETMTMVPSWVRHPKLETFLRVALIFSVVVEGHGLVPNSAACRTRMFNPDCRSAETLVNDSILTCS